MRVWGVTSGCQTTGYTFLIFVKWLHLLIFLSWFHIFSPFCFDGLKMVPVEAPMIPKPKSLVNGLGNGIWCAAWLSSGTPLLAGVTRGRGAYTTRPSVLGVFVYLNLWTFFSPGWHCASWVYYLRSFIHLLSSPVRPPYLCVGMAGYVREADISRIYTWRVYRRITDVSQRCVRLFFSTAFTYVPAMTDELKHFCEPKEVN